MPGIFALALVRGAPRTRANQKKWGIFKCPFRGISSAINSQSVYPGDGHGGCWVTDRGHQCIGQTVWSLRLTSGHSVAVPCGVDGEPHGVNGSGASEIACLPLKEDGR